jgi:hypothetical protein
MPPSTSKRKLPNWLSGYLTMVKDTEPMSRYHLWVAITCIAASLGRKCVMEFGPEILFPNLYTILVGPPGVRKGTAIKYCISLLNEVGICKIAMSGKVTGPQFYIELEQSKEMTPLGPADFFIHHTLFVVADELVNFMGNRDPERLGDLCELYDGKEIFSYRTKNSGTQVIANPGLFLLGATTPNWISECMPNLSVGGGAASRIIFIYASKKGRHIPLSRMKPFEHKLRGHLVNDLAEISQLVGTFKLSSNAENSFAQWYENIFPNMNLGDSRLESYKNRLPSMVLKVAMVHSACRSSSMIIDEDDIVTTIRLFNDAHGPMARTFGGMGLNVLGSQTNYVRELIMERKIVAKSEVLRELKMHISLYDLERIINTLVAEKFIRTEYEQQIGEQQFILL